MVPEIQAEWSVKITRQAHQTGRVSMSYTVSLKVHVETSYGKVENYTLSMNNVMKPTKIDPNL